MCSGNVEVSGLDMWSCSPKVEVYGVWVRGGEEECGGVTYLGVVWMKGGQGYGIGMDRVDGGL